MISRLLSRGFIDTDDKKWSEWRKLLMDEITIDFGGVKPSQTMKADELMAWAKVAYASVKTQHMSFNHDVTINGDKATSRSYGHARHQRTDTSDFWHIYARYDHEFKRTADGWKIALIKMTPTSQEGIRSCLMKPTQRLLSPSWTMRFRYIPDDQYSHFPTPRLAV